MLVNGTSLEHISIRDRGLLYGDGVFETILCEKGKPLLFKEHMQRFSLGCQRLNLVEQNLDEIYKEVCLLTEGEDCVIKLMLTRGERERGYAYNACDLTYTRIVDKSPMPVINHSYYTAGIHLTVCRHRLPNNKKLAGIKHLNRLDQVIGRSECPAEFQEGVMLDHDSNVIEGTMSNVFMLKDNVWYTPDLELCGVKGVMREYLLKNAEELTFNCQNTELKVTDLQAAETMFVCNSVIGIWPVVNFDGQSYPVHAQVKRLQKHLHNHISTLYQA